MVRNDEKYTFPEVLIFDGAEENWEMIIMTSKIQSVKFYIEMDALYRKIYIQEKQFLSSIFDSFRIF